MNLPRPTSIDDFTSVKYRFNHQSKIVLRRGAVGPAVIVIHEVYGFTHTFARFCRWISDAGFQVYAPILFGRPDASNREEQSLGRVASLCISREINLFAQNRSSPVVDWLRPLATRAFEECGGKGVGAIGMCVTGGFALSMAVEPSVLAPVLAQPGSPAGAPAAIDISRTDLSTVARRIDEEGLSVRGYRFEGDKLCTARRFETLEKALGRGFVGSVLPDTAANPLSPMARAKQPPHSVFTGDLVDQPGNPTRQAVDEVIMFLTQRLY